MIGYTLSVKQNTARLNNKGMSLVEVMIGALVLATIASIILSHFYKNKELSKQTDLKTICLNAVAAKISEYKTGPISDGLISSTSTLSTGSYDNMAAGFTYAKTKYNKYFTQGICSNLQGIREWVGSITPPINQNADCSIGPQIDREICRQNPFFKLNVRLQEVNLSNRNQLSCPDATSGNYDFKQRTKGILVIVTGQTILPETDANGKPFTWLGFNSATAQTLNCKATLTVTPSVGLGRFFIDSDGLEIFEYKDMSTASNAQTGNTRIVFPDLASPNNKQLLASDDLSTVMMLREGGELLVYNGCGGNPPTCQGKTPEVRQVPDNISMLGFDDTSSQMFGYFSDSGNWSNLTFNANTLTYSADGNEASMPAAVQRAKPIFSYGTLMKSFVIDNTCSVSNAFTGTLFGTTITQAANACQTIYNGEIADFAGSGVWSPVPKASYDFRIIGITP